MSRTRDKAAFKRHSRKDELKLSFCLPESLGPLHFLLTTLPEHLLRL
jgi:hypothetical protein